MGFLKKREMGFSNKNLDFFIIAKGGKFAVKCDGFSKLPHTVRNLVFYKKKNKCFSKKQYDFTKSAKVKKIAVRPD